MPLIIDIDKYLVLLEAEKIMQTKDNAFVTKMFVPVVVMWVVREEFTKISNDKADTIISQLLRLYCPDILTFCPMLVYNSPIAISPPTRE